MAWQRHTIVSDALRGNALGDPYERPLWIWTPSDGSRRYPAVYVIQGLTGMAAAWFNTEPWTVSYPDAIERLAPDAVVVLVDAFTAVGGSQYVDSPAIGNYHTYLCDEVVPFVDDRHPTIPDRAARGIQGKSSGGYGAMITPLLRPDLFGALATHAGDALFEGSYLRDFAPAARALRDEYGGSFDRFWEDFRSGRPVRSKPSDDVLVNVYAMAAAYSPRADGTVELPFDADTGELIVEVWQRWLAWDPVRLARAPEHAETLRELRGIWIDAGSSDEFFLDLGAAAFRQAVADAGVPDDRVHFELHPGTHSRTQWRYPLSLAWLVGRLSSSS
ncbi:MAG: alpha/beta hydrolase [Gaiellaceae bacterium]